MVTCLFVAVVLSAYRWTAPPGLTWEGNGADGGELALAAHSFGVAHPPGYGLYTFLGGLTLHLLPFGDALQRLHLFSHIASIASALAIGAGVYSLFQPPRSHKQYAAALVSAVFVAFNASVWSLAIIIEVYILSLALFSLIWWLSVKSHQAPNPSKIQITAGFFYGMAISHHLSALLWLPGFAIYNARWGLKGALRMLGGLVMGLWPWLWILVRSGRVPYSNWGGIENGFDAFVYHITAQDYQIYLRIFTIERFLETALQWIESLVTGFGLPFILLAALGVIRWGRRKPLLLFASLAWLLMLLAFTSTYEALHTRIEYLLPLTLVFSIWSGFGVFWLISWVKNQTRLAYIVPLMTAFALIVSHSPKVDLSSDNSALIFADTTFETLPKDAIIITANDQETFTLWYYHYVEQRRADLWLVNLYLLKNEWYRQNLKHLYPEFSITGDTPTAWIGALLQLGRPLAMSTPVPGYKAERIGKWYIIDL